MNKGTTIPKLKHGEVKTETLENGTVSIYYAFRLNESIYTNDQVRGLHSALISCDLIELSKSHFNCKPFFDAWNEIDGSMYTSKSYFLCEIRTSFSNNHFRIMHRPGSSATSRCNLYYNQCATDENSIVSGSSGSFEFVLWYTGKLIDQTINHE